MVSSVFDERTWAGVTHPKVFRGQACHICSSQGVRDKMGEMGAAERRASFKGRQPFTGQVGSVETDFLIFQEKQKICLCVPYILFTLRSNLKIQEKKARTRPTGQMKPFCEANEKPYHSLWAVKLWVTWELGGIPSC